MSWLNAPGGKAGDRLPARVTEHNAVLPCGDGEEVSQTFIRECQKNGVRG